MLLEDLAAELGVSVEDVVSCQACGAVVVLGVDAHECGDGVFCAADCPECSEGGQE